MNDGLAKVLYAAAGVLLALGFGILFYALFGLGVQVQGLFP